MAEESTQIDWTDEQWSAVQQTVRDEAHRTRVAASFLPTSGPLAADAQTVPRQTVVTADIADRERGETEGRLVVDDHDTFWLTTIAANVYLRKPQAADPDLESALIMFRRAANIVARVEDALIFNGQPGANSVPEGQKIPQIYTVSGGGDYRGLLASPPPEPPQMQLVTGKNDHEIGESLVAGVANTISTLEGEGHLGPFACVLGQRLFLAAQTPSEHSLVLPSDRILPFLDGPLLRSSTIDSHKGVVVALAGSPINLVVAQDISVSFLQKTLEPRWVYRVSEKISWRIREEKAIVELKLELTEE